MPRLSALCERERPVEQVADVRKNFRRRPRRRVHLERRETLGRPPHRLAATVRDRSERVSKQFAFLVHSGMIIAQVTSAVVMHDDSAEAGRHEWSRQSETCVGSGFSRTDPEKIRLQHVTAPSAFAISLTSTDVTA